MNELLKQMPLPPEMTAFIAEHWLSLLVGFSILSGLFWLVFWTTAYPRLWSVLLHRWRLFRLKPLDHKAFAKEGFSLSELIPESKFVEVDGTKLHYVQGGSGPDLVLFHGIGASTYIWRYVFPLLETRFRVTAFDIPGFGKSSKERTRDYGLDAQARVLDAGVAALGIEFPIVVGSSMGGAISLWMGKQNPERYAKIMALAPAVDHKLLPPRVQWLAHSAPFLKHALNRMTMKIMLSQVLARRDLVTDATVEKYLEPFLESDDGIRAFWSATSLLSDPRLPSQLKDVQSQVLVLYGERDGLVPRASMDRLMRILPHAKFMTHPNAGHHPMEDEPVWLVEKIIEFAKAKETF